MKNPICQMFGIDVPVFAFSHCRDVVAAVSRAGGFGVFGGGVQPEQLELELKWLDAHTDGKPYGIDFLIPSGVSNEFDDREDLIPAAQRAHTEALLASNNVAPLPGSELHDLQQMLLRKFAITSAQHEKLIEIAFRHSIKLLAVGLGTPPAELIERAHRQGIKVAALIGTPAQALRQRDAGVDFLIAQGTEAGGHTGSISTMVLTPQVVDLVKPLPVLAAGGIASGRQMAAAMCLGAAGVWCGSVWLTTAESDVDPAIKQKIIAATSADAIITRSMTGKPNRVVRSAWTNAWIAPGSPAALDMPLQHLLAQEVMRRAHRSKAPELLSYPAGQVIGQLSNETSVRQVMMEMLSEYADTVMHMTDQVPAETQSAG